jgi:cellulose synthase/poly-beta-1,6-N-acetylglucosamine synthase-like glycosyltransferase
MPGEGKQRALRRCLAEASGEIVYLTDADCLLADEPFERMLAPLILDGEAAASGGALPLPEQRASYFVRHQWARNAYLRRRRGPYGELLAGANAALRADVLRAVDGFGEPASIGVDRLLAGRLRAAGVRIRRVPDGRVFTQFETSLRGYLRQQSRWLKGTVYHEARRGAWGPVMRIGAACALATGWLLLPLVWPRLGILAPIAWATAFLHVVLRSVRQLRYASLADGMPVSPLTYCAAAVYAPLDIARLAYATVDFLIPGTLRRW